MAASRHVPASLDRRVRDRAGGRCEHCRLAQVAQEATFHIDHVQPKAAGGTTTFENLALACVSGSLRKGARTQVPDLETGEIVRLFSPRRDVWDEHFRMTDASVVVGTTEVGQATVEARSLNRLLAVAIRREEQQRGRYP